MHVGFTTEPGELTLGIVAMPLLGLSDRSIKGEFLAQDCSSFSVAERGERAAGLAISGDEALGLFHKSTVKHGGGALIDALVEKRAGRIQAQAQDAVAGEGVAALLPLDGHGSTLDGIGALAGCERDFDGAHDFGYVVGVNGCCRGLVEAGEDAVKIGGAAGGGDVAEAFSLAGLLGWGREEAVNEGSEVEAGASDDDGDVAAFGNAGKGFAGLAAIVACSAGLVGPCDVDHVMRHEGALFARRLGGANLHLAIDGDRVAAYDFTVELLSETESERGFAAGGRPDQNDERLVWGAHHRRHQPGWKRLWAPARKRLKRNTTSASRSRPRIWRRRSVWSGVAMVVSLFA